MSGSVLSLMYDFLSLLLFELKTTLHCLSTSLSNVQEIFLLSLDFLRKCLVKQYFENFRERMRTPHPNYSCRFFQTFCDQFIDCAFD